MKTKILNYALIFLSAGILLSSCNNKVIDFAIISTRDTKLDFNPKEIKNGEGEMLTFLSKVYYNDVTDFGFLQYSNQYDVLIEPIFYSKRKWFKSGYKIKTYLGRSGDLFQKPTPEEYKEFQLWLKYTKNKK